MQIIAGTTEKSQHIGLCIYRLSFLETKIYITPINWPWLRSLVQILMIESFGCNLIL